MLYRALACISHRFPAAAPDTLAVTGRTHCSRFDVVSATPSPPSTVCTSPQRRLAALVTKNGVICRLGFIALALLTQAATADIKATTADGREVLLRDNGTWTLVTDQSGEEASKQAILTLEKKFDLARGCRLGLRLKNDLAAQIRTLVLRFTAYKGDNIPFETVSRGFSYIKPTTSQYQEISFRGISCDEIGAVEVSAARNCHVGELTKYSASEERCLELIEISASDLLPIARRISAD